MSRASASYATTFTGATAAQFAAGVGPISTMLNTAFTKTGDTGQTSAAALNAYSAGVPATATTSTLYEVFGFSDSLQATKPVFLRVGYGADGIAVTVGTSTNGAGVVAGTAFGLPATLLGPSSSVGNTRYGYAAGGDGTFMNVALNILNQSATNVDALGAIVVERTRDPDGTANGDGLNLWLWNTTATTQLSAGNNSWVGKYGRDFANSGTQPAVVYDIGAVVPFAAATTNWGTASTNYAFPVYQHLNNTVYGASKALLLGGVNDYARQSVYTVTHYGTAMQFFSEGPGHPMSLPYASAANTVTTRSGLFTPLLRFE